MDRKSLIILLTILGVFWFLGGGEKSVALANSARESAVGKKVGEEAAKMSALAKAALDNYKKGHADALASMLEGPLAKAAALA